MKTNKNSIDNKKTILITLERGMIVRNIVNSGVLGRLAEKYNLIIATPLPNDKRLLKHVGLGFKYHALHNHNYSRFEEMFVAVYKSLIYNETVHIKSKYGFKHKALEGVWSGIRFWFVYIVFGLFLSKIKPLRKLWRFLDKIFFTKDYYEDLFLNNKIDAVFVANIHWKNEAYLLKSAQKHKVPCIGMTKSWDNFSKDGYRAKVDRLVVWNDFMRDEAIEYQGYKTGEIDVVGVPQFDIYKSFSKSNDRDEFLKIYGLSPLKKVIVFGQESKFLSPEDKSLVYLLKNWIIENRKNYQILIRPHFAHEESLSEFLDLVDNDVVFLDTIHSKSKFKDTWDYSFTHDRRLALTMTCADVVITSVSTLILDACAADTEVITYNFDVSSNVRYKDSISRLYEVLWFIELRKSGLDEFTCCSFDDLTSRIEGVLEGGLFTSQKTKESLQKRFLYKVDGNSAERLENSISTFVG